MEDTDDSRPERHTASGSIELGVVVRPHGVRGALKVRLHNPASSVPDDADPADLALRREDGTVHSPIALVARTGGFIVVKLAGADDREAAEGLRNAVLLVDRRAVALEPDEYLVAELIGCEVREKDRSFGRVRDVMSAGGSDVLVVGQGADERMIPLVDDWVESVDLGRKTIEIRDGEAWDELAGETGRAGD